VHQPSDSDTCIQASGVLGHAIPGASHCPFETSAWHQRLLRWPLAHFYFRSVFRFGSSAPGDVQVTLCNLGRARFCWAYRLGFAGRPSQYVWETHKIRGAAAAAFPGRPSNMQLENLP
jgi:hypothetical protein